MIWEGDDAYRYRGQDLAGKIKLNQLIENPAKEIIRVANILIERETKLQMKEKYTPVIWALKVLIFFKKGQVKRIISVVAREVDLKKIALDDADFYHCMMRNEYNYKGISAEERAGMRKKIDEEYNKLKVK